MKIGDLVRVHKRLRHVYGRQDQVGVVVRIADGRNGMLVLWQDGVSLFARPDLLEVVNESR